MENHDIRVKKQVELQRAITYLKEIITALQQGQVCVEHGEDALVLTPPSAVTFQVKARTKKDKNSVSLKLSWMSKDREEAEEPQPEPVNLEPELRITTKSPVKQPATHGHATPSAV